MVRRKKIPKQVQTDLFLYSRRRCCICYGLNGDNALKRGQIAHLDGDPSNPEFENLAWLCFEHHDEYDSKTSQSKGLTIHEVKEYRKELYEAVEGAFRERNFETELYDSRTVPEPLEESIPPVKEARPSISERQEVDFQTNLERVTKFSLEDEEVIRSCEDRAEKLIASEKHEEAADAFAGLAERLANRRQPVQARKYAKRAAEQYLAAGNKEAAAEQQIKAAEAWIEQTSYEPLLVRRDIEKAEELASEANSFIMKARASVLHARLLLLSGDFDKLEELWEKADKLLLKVLGASQVELYCDLALQRALYARLHEEYDRAVDILLEAVERDWSTNFLEQRFELLRVLMFLQADIGDWDAVEQTNQTVRQDLQKQSNPLAESIWSIHYAGALARRGRGEDALAEYTRALERLEKGSAQVSLRHHLYQDMVHVMFHYADFHVSKEVLPYDSRRLDLALNVLHETSSARYLQRAEERFLEGELEAAIDWGRAALMLAWRDGSWSSANRAYRVLARLYAKGNQPLQAIFAAVHAGDYKNVREYAERAASTTDSSQVKQLMKGLLRTWPTAVQQRHALMALAGCADVIPSDQLNTATDHALEVLSKFSQDASGREASRRAAQLLYSLAPRFSAADTDRVIRVCIDELGRAHFLIMQEELVKILRACFANKHPVDPALYEPALEAILSVTSHDAVRQDGESAMIELAAQSPDRIRERIVTYFQQESDWAYLAAIGEYVPEETIREAIEEILVAITPRWEEGSISYSGWRAQSIINFNDVLPPSLYDFVVDGLLEAATNAEGFARQRSGAIRTLRWLPEEAISERADRIAVVLLDICENVNSESGTGKGFWNALGGPSNQIVQSSLYTLGHLYEWVSADIRERILERILFSSDHNDILVRTGAAMALRMARGSAPLPFQIVMTLERLLSDREPTVRQWAAAATGHLVIQPLLREPSADYFTERLAKLALTEEDAFARSGMAYGLRVIAERGEGTLPQSVTYALEQLANDISFQVRRQAKSERED